MRVNIYGEELTSRVELEHKTVNQKSFYGVRFYLKSHPDLHHSPTDNDESAVTFWVPWTKLDGNQYDILKNLLEEGVSLLKNKMIEDGWTTV